MRSWRPFLFAFLFVVACSGDTQEPASQLANHGVGGQHGWQWSNPKPQGNELNDVSIHGNVGYAVGRYGAIVSTLDGGLNWTLQPSGVLDELNGVEVTGWKTAIAVGTGGTILRTNNRGATWDRRGSGVTANLNDVAFADATHGIAVGDNVVLRTNDGGLTWTSSDFDAALQAVCVVSANLAFAVSGDRVYTSEDGGATWSMKRTGYSGNLYAICFTDARTGTTVGDNGLILRTIDGGATWTNQDSDTRAGLRGVSFVDADNGLVVGTITTAPGPTVLHTSDGGATWNHDYPLTPVVHAIPDFQSVAMLDGSQAIAVGGAGNILRSADGGRNWEDRTQAPAFRLFKVSFADANNGVAVGFGDILQTTDGGATWQRRSEDLTLLWDVAYSSATNVVAVGGRYLPPGGGIVVRSTDAGATWTTITGVGGRAVDFADASTGTLVGDKAIFRTIDGGASWLPQPSGSTENLNDVAVLNADIGIAVGDKGTIVRTTDGGTQWQGQSHPELSATDLKAVDFCDSEVGFIVGDSPIILRTTDGGLTWTSQDGVTNNGGFIDVACVDRKSAAILMPRNALVTTDGGEHWTPTEPFNAVMTPYALSISGRKTVTVVGDFGVILQNRHIFP